MRELTFKEKYVLCLILQEVEDKWSKSQIYQGLRTLLDEELGKYIQKAPKIDFSKEYDCKWENSTQ